MYRNPSPPPQETVPENVDRIVNTAYSQCWVLKALVALSSQTLKDDERLSEELENEFCQLWDMSSDKHVGSFMLDKGLCDLILAPLVRSSNFRVREVSLGIIANLMCHKASAKEVTEHDTLRTFVPTLLREDDVSVLTETVRLLRAALALETDISDRWRRVLPDDTVERLIHIIQSTLNMTSVRASVLKEHCAMMLEILFYQDEQLLANSAYTVFPIVDILQNRSSQSLEEPLLRCLQYLCEEKRAVTNMSQCPGLPKVLHRVMSQKIEHGLTAVCLSLICTLLTSQATDEMCAWLEKDCNITESAIRTLHSIILDDEEERENKSSEISSNISGVTRASESCITETDSSKVAENGPDNQIKEGPSQEGEINGHGQNEGAIRRQLSNNEEPPNEGEPPNEDEPNQRNEGHIETPTPKSAGPFENRTLHPYPISYPYLRHSVCTPNSFITIERQHSTVHPVHSLLNTAARHLHAE
ncbi:protein saal1-like [Bolinopsis microptera]|uniref:protein saal1-like n=1 Tax=Bolinopsis microptera TaxID=2820187 RepID=UPI003078E3DE